MTNEQKIYCIKCGKELVENDEVFLDFINEAFVHTECYKEDDSTIFIKPYGLRRTSTNFIKAVLEDNFNAKLIPHIGDSKHSEPHIINPDFSQPYDNFIDREKLDNKEQIELLKLNINSIKYLLCVKNPYSWLVSIHKYSTLTIENFDYRITDLKNKKQLANAIQKWNVYNQNVIKFCKENPNLTYLLRTENLICGDIEREIQNIAMKFYLTQLGENLAVTNNIVDPRYLRTNVKFNPDYYVNEEYLNMFSREDLDYINQLLDRDVMKTLCYEER